MNENKITDEQIKRYIEFNKFYKNLPKYNLKTSDRKIAEAFIKDSPLEKDLANDYIYKYIAGMINLNREVDRKVAKAKTKRTLTAAFFNNFQNVWPNLHIDSRIILKSNPFSFSFLSTTF